MMIDNAESPWSSSKSDIVDVCSRTRIRMKVVGNSNGSRILQSTTAGRVGWLAARREQQFLQNSHYSNSDWTSSVLQICACAREVKDYQLALVCQLVKLRVFGCHLLMRAELNCCSYFENCTQWGHLLVWKSTLSSRER